MSTYFIRQHSLHSKTHTTDGYFIGGIKCVSGLKSILLSTLFVNGRTTIYLVFEVTSGI